MFNISIAGKQTELVANIYHNFREKEKSSGIRVIGPLQAHLWDTIKIQNSSGPLLTFPDPFVKDRAFSPANHPDSGVSVPEFGRLGLSGLCARLQTGRYDLSPLSPLPAKFRD
jgi:hypothetical protein